MDWKSTAVISGAGVLATWFFSMPPAQQPVAVPVPPAVRAQSASRSVDIQQEAARLQVRTPPTQRYVEPARNPFRFSEARQPQPAAAVAAPVITVPVAPPPPPPLQLELDGIASDVIDGVMQRTAILKTDAGVVLAKEGDQVAGFHVDKVAPDSVELTKISDSSVLRLGLR